MNTWVITPNWLAWTLLIIASFSLGVIAMWLWCPPKNGVKWGVSSNINKAQLRFGELYKTTILTAWLAFSAWLMWKVYNNPSLSNDKEFWSNMIAIIAIIVATLIGWQIYSAMDWNNKADRISKMEDGYISLLSEIASNRNFSEASMLYMEVCSRIDIASEDPDNFAENYEDYYLQLLRAISLFTSQSVEEAIENCISRMYSVIDAMERYNTGSGDDFQDDCDCVYKTIKENKRHLTVAQQDKLRGLENRRKQLKAQKK